jgi:hypothetical protein
MSAMLTPSAPSSVAAIAMNFVNVPPEIRSGWWMVAMSRHMNVPASVVTPPAGG